MNYLPPIRVYSLTFLIDRDAVTSFLDAQPQVLNWRTISPFAVLIASRSDLVSLQAMIHTQVPWLYFMLMPVDGSNTAGWWTQDLWEFINFPKSSGRWPD